MTRGFNYWRNGTKYNATKCVVDGHTFDSKHEANRYAELKMLLKAGVIKNLGLQIEFELIPAQYEEVEKTLKSGKKKLVKGKCLERKCSYFADFVYTEVATNKMIVEDAKSKATRTPEYIIKRKLMLERHGIVIREI